METNFDSSYICKYMNNHHITVAALAKKTNMYRTTISRIISGKTVPNVSNIEKIANALHFSGKDLLALFSLDKHLHQSYAQYKINLKSLEKDLNMLL